MFSIVYNSECPASPPLYQMAQESTWQDTDIGFAKCDCGTTLLNENLNTWGLSQWTYGQPRCIVKKTEKKVLINTFYFRKYILSSLTSEKLLISSYRQINGKNLYTSTPHCVCVSDTYISPETQQLPQGWEPCSSALPYIDQYSAFLISKRSSIFKGWFNQCRW